MSIEAMKRIKSLLQDTKMIDSHTISAVVAECDMAILTQQPATGEPVVVQHRKPVIGWKGEAIGYTAWRDGKGLDGWPHRELYDHPAPSVPMTNEQWDDVLGSAGPDLLDLAKQWSDNKVDVYQVINEAEKIVKAAVLRGITAQAKKDTP